MDEDASNLVENWLLGLPTHTSVQYPESEANNALPAPEILDDRVEDSKIDNFENFVAKCRPPNFDDTYRSRPSPPHLLQRTPSPQYRRRQSQSGSSVLSIVRSVCSSVHQWATRKRKRSPSPRPMPSKYKRSPAVGRSGSDSTNSLAPVRRLRLSRYRTWRIVKKRFALGPNEKGRVADDISKMATTGPVASSTNNANKEISGVMSAVEVMALLVDSGCLDVTEDLDVEGFSNMAISAGGFGDVYRGKLQNGLLVAVKCPRWLAAGVEKGQGVFKDVARELHAWSKCKHLHVLELLGMAGFRNQIAMVSPWMINGTMPQYLNANPGVGRHELCSEIAKAVEYLHGIDVVHGDIKGANILISDQGQAKLGDFGNSILKHCTLQFSGASFVPSYSLRWAAPELLKGEVRSSKAADVYALGMTILEAFTGDVPYAGKSDYAVLFSVTVKAEVPLQPGEAMGSLWNLVMLCWKRNPSKRPAASQVVQFLLPLIKKITGLTIYP